MSDDYTLGWHRGKRTIDFTDHDGQRVRRSLGTDDEGLAEQRAKEWWAIHTAAPSDRVSDLWPVYVRDRMKEVARKDRFKATWTALEPHFGHRIGTAIGRDDCRAYYASRKAQGKADSTVLTELQLLRACLKMTLGERAPDLWMPPESKPRSLYLTPADMAKVHADSRTPHIALFLELALATGARATAICDLTWDRVDLKHGFVDLMPAGRIKTNKNRPVVKLTKRALAALERAKEAAQTDHVIEFNGKPIKSVKKALQRISERTGVDFSPHVLRHSAGVWMAKENVPLQKISQFLGHSSTRVTEKVYARYQPGFMEEAADALEW